MKAAGTQLFVADRAAEPTGAAPRTGKGAASKFREQLDAAGQRGIAKGEPAPKGPKGKQLSDDEQMIALPTAAPPAQAPEPVIVDPAAQAAAAAPSEKVATAIATTAERALATIATAVSKQIAPPTAAGATTGAAAGAAALGAAASSVGAPAAAVAPPPPPPAETAAPLTPLEQTVQELIGALRARDEDKREGAAEASSEALLEAADRVAIHTATAAPVDEPAPVAPVAAPRPIADAPEPPANPSHVNLVIDDGGERIVVAVAVRGSDVNVAIRGGDEQTAAALSRSAASLDHAMRGRGLDLARFSAERDPNPSGDARREPHQREREQRQSPFQLEEML